MKRIRELSIVLVSLFVLSANCYSQATEDLPAPDFLSIEKSLLPMFHERYYTSANFPFNRINPDVKEYLHFYLEKDNSIGLFSARAISLLGYIGNKEDILFVDNFLQELLTSLSRDRWLDDNIALGAGRFSGMMIKRKIEGAESFFKKYATALAWAPPGEDNPQIISNARYAHSVFMIKAYDFSKEGYVLQSLQVKSTTGTPYRHEREVANLVKRKTDLYTQNMKPVKVSGEKLQESLNRNLGEVEGIEAVMNKQTVAQWRKLSLEKRKLSRQKPKKKSSLGLFENIALTGTVEGEYLKAVGGEAARAYVQVSEKLLNNEAKSLPIKKEILRDIRNAGRKKHNSFHVKINVAAAVADFVYVNEDVVEDKVESNGTSTEPAVIKEKETSAVTFDIQDTADIYKKHVPDAGDDPLVSPTTGNVKIHMKRHKNKWYWDPEPEEPDVVMKDGKLNLSPALKSNESDVAVAGIVEDEDLVAIVSEAIAAFKQLSRMILDGDYDPLTIPILDNYKLIPLKKREKSKDRMIEFLNLEKRVLEDINAVNLNRYRDFHVELDIEAALSNFTPVINGVHENKIVSDKTVEVNGYETATVTFMIQNAGQMYKKHASKKATQRDIDKAGNMQVYMKRINGKWYWNPFGW